MIRSLFLILLTSLLILGCDQASPAPDPAAGVQTPLPPVATATPVPHGDLLAAIRGAVEESYLYVDASGQIPGVEWADTFDQIAAQVDPAMDPEAFVALVRTGLAILPPGAVIWQTRSDAVADVKATVGGYEGIGVYLGARGEPEPAAVVLEVVPDSPAERAGLTMHDRILAVDGLPVTPDEGMAVVERIRGPRDSQVILTVAAPGGEVREVAVTRSQMSFVQPKSLFAQRLVDGQVGYMRFPAGVHATLGQDFTARLQEMGGPGGIEGLILDLRISNNSTGWPLMTLLPLFGQGEMGTVVSRKGDAPLRIAAGEGRNLADLPLVILVGPDTQGSAEIFAAALQAAGHATLVGLPTLGQVEGMTVKRLPDGSQLLIANTTFRTPDGRDIGQTGVQPDILVAADWGDVSAQADPVIGAALGALEE